MALKPADRYQSPKGLADDVEHWLADEPVSAYREPLPAKAARWARKHKTLVVSSFGLIAVAAIALGVSTVLIRKQQVLTEAARQTAVENFELAESARDQARRRYQLALDALNDMVFGIQTKLETRPGTEDLRKDLLENARKRLQSCSRRPSGKATRIRRSSGPISAWATWIRCWANTLDAKKEYASGCEIAKQLAEADPSSSQAQSDLGISYVNLGNIAQQLGQTQEALDYYRKALAIRQHRAEADPKDAKAQRGLSINYELLGDVSRRSGQTQDALDFYRKASAIRQLLADADTTNVQAQYDLSIS